MSLYDWLLFLHVFTAFVLVAALVIFWVVGIVARNVDTANESMRYFRVTRPATILIGVGAVGTLILGIALAIERDEYHVWDGWILGAIVLWALSSELGRRGGKPYAEAAQLNPRLAAEGRGDEPNPELRGLLRDRNAIVLNALATLGYLVILIDMIYKPGA